MKKIVALIIVHLWAAANVSWAVVPHVKSPGRDACKLYTKLSHNKIVGDSQVAQRGEFPWMAAIGVVDFDVDAYRITFACGGTIISDYFVMTAAHCLSYKRLPNIVRLGKLNLNDNIGDDVTAQNYYIKEIFEHPNYSPITNKNDIGLIQLSSRIEFTPNIRPACLNFDVRDEQPYTDLIVTGWGVTKPGGSQSKILLKAILKTFPLAECTTTFLKYNEQANDAAFRNGISEGQYCAYDPTPRNKSELRTDSCQGDSGGPLQHIPSGSTIATIVGIVSAGISCGTDLPGLYTRVAYYVDWIESIVWRKSIKTYSLETFFKANWFKAYLSCKASGKRLASIKSRDENDKIVNQIRDAGYQNHEFWTSGVRIDGRDRDFNWIGSGNKFGYTNWEARNPDNDGGDQYCVQLWASYDLQWDDTECFAEKYFVCEDGGAEISQNTKQISTETKRYSLVTSFRGNWFKAFTWCRSNGKQLVSIMSQTENDEISRLIRKSGHQQDAFWISGARVDSENFYWMGNGNKFGYSNWNIFNGRPNPDNLTGRQYCVQLIASQWDDTECDTEKYFVCEG